MNDGSRINTQANPITESASEEFSVGDMSPLKSDFLVIVDDEETPRFTFSRSIKKFSNDLGINLDVQTAVNGVEALTVIKRILSLNGRIRLILSDINMPEMDGIELYHELLKIPELAGTNILFATGDPNNLDGPLGEILEQNPTHTKYLSKPTPMSTLKQIIESTYIIPASQSKDSSSTRSSTGIPIASRLK